MSEEDDYRVEARLAGASRGVSPTTEQIQTLLERQRSHEKLTRPPPQKAFARVMREQRGEQGEGSGEPSQHDAPDEASVDANAPAPQSVDTFVRRRPLPPGFQRSGRTQTRAPASKAAARTPLPDGPQARQVSATEVAPHPDGKKVIIRG